MSILSGTRSFHQIDAGAVAAVVDAARRGGATVVRDIPRLLTSAANRALQFADLAVVVTRCDVRAIAATTAMLGSLRNVNPAVGLVVRARRREGLRAKDVAEAAAAPLLAAMRPESMLAQRLEQGGLRPRGRSPLHPSGGNRPAGRASEHEAAAGMGFADRPGSGNASRRVGPAASERRGRRHPGRKSGGVLDTECSTPFVCWRLS